MGGKGMNAGKIDKQSLVELALKFPFYQWFYEKEIERKGIDGITYDDIPVLEKENFFEYEKSFGEPYFTGIRECMNSFIESTSGTTGKSLDMIRPFKTLELLYAAIGKSLSQYLSSRPVMMTQEYPSGTWNTYWVQFPKQDEYKAVEDLIGIVNVPLDHVLDADEVSHAIVSSEANVLFDPTGQWTHALLKRDLALRKYGIQVIMVLNPEPHIWEEIARNFQWAGMYGGTDGCGAVTCPYIKRPGVYHPYEDYAEVHVLEDGKVKEYGEGLLVIDKYNEQLFPFVKYMPHDMVRLKREPCQCGEGKSLYMLGRAAREVRVPNQIETAIQLGDVEAILSTEGQYLMVYTKIRSNETIYGEHRVLISFVERKDVSSPRESKELSQKIAEIHGRGYIAYALPVVLVQEGTLTGLQMEDVKLRNFLNAITTFPYKYRTLIEVSREVGLEIVSPVKVEQ
jgi:phenylacetate-coenzyme A ligase PaaK-like adenylate-forming protein